MISPAHKSLYISLISALLLGHAPVFAEQNTNNTQAKNSWFHVEVFVFANNNNAAAYGEQWPTELGLQYPTPITQLTEPALKPSELTPFSPIGQQRVTVKHFDANSSTPSNDNSLPEKETEIISHVRPPAFEKLPNDQHFLKQAARKISRNNSYRALFHHAWIQPMTDKASSSNILIQGGQAFDKHFELEGSIKLSIARYLHIETDLWLNTFVANTQTTAKPLSTLPEPPFQVEKNPEIYIDANTPLPEVIDKYRHQAASFSREQYYVDRTVVLRQHRRMRSQELHYIDHPLFGLLIKLTPYTNGHH